MKKADLLISNLSLNKIFNFPFKEIVLFETFLAMDHTSASICDSANK